VITANKGKRATAYPEARRIHSGELPLPRITNMNRNYFFFFLLVCTGILAGCNSSTPAVVEHGPVAYQPTPVSTPTTTQAKTDAAAEPKFPEVEEAVNRIFKGLATIHPDYKTSFLVGDFNGDASQDLAVVLKPVPEKIAEMNEQPTWLLRDPRVPYNPRVPLHVEKNDVLLAVIHGYGANDWRDPQATQTFLLKNVAGAGLHVQGGKEFIEKNTGRRIPRPNGDLIGETLKGVEGYLYYSAASYSWYDPKTFAGEDETARAFHGRGGMRRTK